uniref:Histone-lysine N-methyltransferase, H3 lysine-79 specific n=1 Tax=Strongyloides stercoralis TaxID=6248 RepID=A0A0K0EK33_STRER
MTSPANFSTHRIILPIRSLDAFNFPFKFKIIEVSDFPDEIETASEIGFSRVVVKPFFFMVIARCCQFMALENSNKFRSFCSDTLQEYYDDIERYCNLIFQDLTHSTILDEVVKFLTSIIRYRDEVRNYFVHEFKNTYPEPFQAPRSRKMSESQSIILFKMIKECFAKKKTLQKYYNAGTEYVYGELNPHAFFQINVEEYNCYEGDNFFDCGAGIFNIVAIAAVSKCLNRCIGIELNPGVACPGALLLIGFYHVARFANFYFNTSTHIVSDFNNPVLEPLLFSRPSMMLINNFVLSSSTMDPFFEKLAVNQKAAIKFVLTKEASFYRKLPTKGDEKKEDTPNDQKKMKHDILTNHNFTKKVINHIERVGSWTNNKVTVYFYYRSYDNNFLS